jgi:hypothetical protein
MTIQDYESLRRARPDLVLPSYPELTRSARKRLRKLGTRQELIARATAIILRHDAPFAWGGLRIRHFMKATNGK